MKERRKKARHKCVSQKPKTCPENVRDMDLKILEV